MGLTDDDNDDGDDNELDHENDDDENDDDGKDVNVIFCNLSNVLNQNSMPTQGYFENYTLMKNLY